MLHQKATTFKVGQYAKVNISATKSEIGVIESLDDKNATLSTTSGFTVTYPRSKLARTVLVILDLNGVIGYRKKSKLFRKRPHLDELLPFLFKNFVVGVWTSAPEHNGIKIVEDCFGPFEARLVFKLYRDACTPNVTPSNPFGTVKDLRVVWSRFVASFDETNTIIIDDSEDKCSHRQNTLVPTPYRGEGDFDLEGSEPESLDPDTGLDEILHVLSRVVERESLDPVREHMLAKWNAQLMSMAAREADDASSNATLTPPSLSVSAAATPTAIRSPVPEATGTPPVVTSPPVAVGGQAAVAVFPAGPGAPSTVPVRPVQYQGAFSVAPTGQWAPVLHQPAPQAPPLPHYQQRQQQREQHHLQQQPRPAAPTAAPATPPAESEAWSGCAGGGHW